MKTVAIASQKGGTAKSTLCRHLAVSAQRAGLKVVVVDSDQQATLRAWGEARGREPKVIAETSTTRRYVEQALSRLRESGVDLCLIDTPGTMEGAYAPNAISVADFVLIPCRPSGEDTAAFWQLEERVQAAGKAFGAVVTQAPTTTLKPAADLMALFRESGVNTCPVPVHQRQSVPASYAGGSTVFEADRPDDKAVAEMTAVWQWVAQQVGVQS